jgi:hypothetical protein
MMMPMMVCNLGMMMPTNLENEGSGIGHGGWVDGQWHDPIDPHPIAPKERHSGSEFDPDYIPNPVQVMTTHD